MVLAGKATSIKLLNGPAFVSHLDVEVDVPTIGKVTIDIAFGGMWCVARPNSILFYFLMRACITVSAVGLSRPH